MAKRAFQRIVLERERADVHVRRLHIQRRLHGVSAVREEPRGAYERLVLPRRDRGGVRVNALQEYRERALAFDGSQGDFGFEGGDRKAHV